MTQLIILLLGLTALSVITLKFTKSALLSPQFAFAACFIPQVAYSFFFIKHWSLDLSWKTVAVMLGGCALFALTSFLTGFLFDKKAKTQEVKFNIQSENQINCSKYHLILFALLQLGILVWTIAFLLKAYGNFDLSAAIAHFNDTNKFSEQTIHFPFVLGKLKILSLASGYIWSYILIHSFVNKYKSEKLLLFVNIGLCLINTVITGSRTDAFQLLVAIVVQLYFIYGKKYGWIPKISLKAGLILIGSALVLVFSFQAVGNLMGRGSTVSIWEYIAIYLSAELKNLDTFIRAGDFGAPVGQWQTLITIVNIIGNRFGMPHLVHKFDLPFHTANGHDLGNVATTFYAFLYDGGYVGVIIFVIIMAVICQLVYKLATRNKSGKGEISLSTVIYSYVFFTVVFSFFSNKFYEHIFAGYFVYLIVFWILLKIYVQWLNKENCKLVISKIKSKLNKNQ